MLTRQFDVVVVGAGAAGAPLAARLSEDPSRRVLLVEAGPDAETTEDFPPELLNAASLTAAMPQHPRNWGFFARLTPELAYVVARGKGLGGSTSINGTYFVRARREDFDRWVAAGNDEWSYEAVLPYYRRIEHDLEHGETSVHGGFGPVPVTRTAPDDQSTLGRALNAAFAELGFPAEPDKNDEGQPGFGPLPRNSVDGVRINTGMAFINPVRDRPNLTIWADTFVRRVVVDGTTATGVEVERDGRVEVITASEVVLAAGAIKTPHVLLLSGIGPREELRRAGVPVLCDLPGVGKDFTDHPDVTFSWVARQKNPVSGRLFETVLNWRSTGSPYRDGDLELLPSLTSFGHAMLTGAGSDWRTVVGMLAHPITLARSLRGVSLPHLVQQARTRKALFFSVGVQQAASRGQITLGSADPHVQPRIDYHYLSDPWDRERMREAIRVSAQVLRSRAMAPWFKRFADIDEATLSDDDALDAWLLSHLSTAIHMCGSARMGPRADRRAVVDQHGRVHGLTGLRVADTSIFPFTPLRGPAATAMMVGDRIADLMIGEQRTTG